MRGEQIVDLKDCSEFRQTLLAKSPSLPHVTAMMLMICLFSAVIWAGFSQANLIVRAGGRMRPLIAPTQVFCTAGGEVTGSSMGNRITQVNFRAGDVVKKGDTLLELDSHRIDAEIEQQEEVLRSNREEVKRLSQLLGLLELQFSALQKKQQAEVNRAQEDIDLQSRKRESEIRLATAELEHAEKELEIAKQVATKLDLLKATLAVAQLKEKKAQAELPVEQGHLIVYQRALELATHDYEVKKQELSINLAAKQGAVATAENELERLTVERRNTRLIAPFDGIVTHGRYEVGDVLPQGEPAYEIAGQSGLLFEAAVTSEDIGLISVGMPVRMKLDAYYYQKYGTLDGTVEYVSPDSITDEESEKKIVAYLVRIKVKNKEFGHGMDRAIAKLGMAGTAEIVTGQESILFLFFQNLRQSISLD